MEFKFKFDYDEFVKCLPHNKNPKDWYAACFEILPKYEINTIERVAGFLAQCQHESADFNVVQENLNYSVLNLQKVFRKYFPNGTIATQYARKPEKIANRVYANRMGNGNEASGDGWKYRGRGILQLTGKANYAACSQVLFGDDTLVKNPDLLSQPHYALLSACWFWEKNNLNAFCDKRDIVGMTKRVNGGVNGLADRTAHWNTALKVLGD
jgi:putative chitinase